MKEREISLLDLCVEILLRWRVILLAMLIGGVLLGAFSYVNSRRAAGSLTASEEEEQKELEERRELVEGWEQEAGEDIDAWVEEYLTEKQLANIDTLLFHEEAYETRRVYQENSIYMNLDPNSVAHGEITFLIDAGGPEETNRVVQIYEDLATAGELAERLGEELGVSPASIRELMFLERSAYGQTVPVNTLRLSVMYGDEENCGKMLQAIDTYFAEQQKLLEGEIGAHSIRALSRSVSTGRDTALAEDQIRLKNEQISRETSIAAIKDAFADEETFYYIYLTEGDFSEMMVLEKEEGEKKSGAKPSEGESAAPSARVSVKYILLGMILAAFVYVFVLFVRYIMEAKLRYTDDVQELYEIPVLGRIPVERKKKPLDFVDRWIYALRDRNRRSFSRKEAVLLSAAGAKIAARKKGVGTVCCLGCGLRENSLEVCGQIQAELAEEGLNVSILNNVLYDAEAMEQLSSVGSAVLVETAGVTLYDEILKELELLQRQEIEVLGCVVVEG